MIVELVKPRLFLSKVPMVYGTVISNAIVFGAIVFGAAMLVQFRPELEQHRHRHRPGRRTPASWTRRSASSLFPRVGAVSRASWC
jgi:hypothetical protein|tara:strand:+ start:241 stop:495 length:255 start_codon:yes stop_codon:yes gene_type:complete